MDDQQKATTTNTAASTALGFAVGGPVGAVLGFAAGAYSGISGKRAATRARRARRAEYQRQIEAMMDTLRDVGVEGRRLAGRQRASYAAAGVDVNEGTAAETQDISLGEMLLTQSRILRGVQAIRHQIHREHRGSKAINLEMAVASAMGATSASIDAYLNATRNRTS